MQALQERLVMERCAVRRKDPFPSLLVELHTAVVRLLGQLLDGLVKVCRQHHIAVLAHGL